MSSFYCRDFCRHRFEVVIIGIIEDVGVTSFEKNSFHLLGDNEGIWTFKFKVWTWFAYKI